MLLTESGILIDVKFLQYANALSPICLIEFGMMIDVRLLQYENV